MGYGGIPQSVKSIVLIPINGNSCKLVYHGVGFGLFFIAEISSETRRKRCNYHLNHQTFEGNKRVQVQHPLQVLPNAFECTMMQRETFEKMFANFWLYNCVFSPITNGLAVDKSDPGWLPFGMVIGRRDFCALFIGTIYRCIYIEIVCISKLISITRSCIHEITWCWFRCLNFKAFTKFHKHVFFQKYWYSKNLPPNNISKHHHSILGLASTSVADEDVSLNLVTRQWNSGWEAAEFGWLDRINAQSPNKFQTSTTTSSTSCACCWYLSLRKHPWKITKPWNMHPSLMVFTRKERELSHGYVCLKEGICSVFLWD